MTMPRKAAVPSASGEHRTPHRAAVRSIALHHQIVVGTDVAVAKQVNNTVATYGRLDYAFNNAGIVPHQKQVSVPYRDEAGYPSDFIGYRLDRLTF
jgi:NAD(P)-dependent dehydrogenase (short-subunit alcohol dehydrogenase family)